MKVKQWTSNPFNPFNIQLAGMGVEGVVYCVLSYLQVFG